MPEVNPLLVIGGLLLTQTVAVWVLTAAAWKQPLPGELFPVNGRWLRYLAQGYLVLTLPGPAVTLVVIPDSPPSRGVSVPNAVILLFWLFADGVWLGASAAVVTALYCLLDMPRRSEKTTNRKCLPPGDDDRTT